MPSIPSNATVGVDNVLVDQFGNWVDRNGARSLFPVTSGNAPVLTGIAKRSQFIGNPNSAAAKAVEAQIVALQAHVSAETARLATESVQIVQARAELARLLGLRQLELDRLQYDTD